MTLPEDSRTSILSAIPRTPPLQLIILFRIHSATRPTLDQAHIRRALYGVLIPQPAIQATEAALRRMEAAQDSWTRHKPIHCKTRIDAAEGRKLQQSPAGVIGALLSYADPVQLSPDSSKLLPDLGRL
jgi:hypothetical protein